MRQRDAARYVKHDELPERPALEGYEVRELPPEQAQAFLAKFLRQRR